MSWSEFPGAQVAAITFDVGGTLIEPWPSVGHVYARVAERFGLAADPAALNDAFAQAWKAQPVLDYCRPAWKALVDATFLGAGAPRPGESCFEAIYRQFAEPESWRVFEDVVPTLEALTRAGFPLGVISNWDERLRPLLERLDLARWFGVMSISHEVGATKPSPAIYEHAVRGLGVPAGRVLHVGDRVEEDVRGAQAAGLSALLLDRAGRNSWALGTLRVLPAAVASLRSPPSGEMFPR